MSRLNESVEITLALPTYNEEQNIAEVLERCFKSLSRLGRSWEVLVIDNHSSDATASVVNKVLEGEPRGRLIVHDKNHLYSGSCQTALREAKGKYIAIMDSDGQAASDDLPKFLEKLEAGFNLVMGWRRIRHDTPARKLLSCVFNLLGKLWLQYPFHDLNCGFRMFDREFLRRAAIEHRINMANPELYVRARVARLKIAEVEVQHFERLRGQTSHDLKDLFRIFLSVNQYFMALSQETKQNPNGKTVGKY